MGIFVLTKGKTDAFFFSIAVGLSLWYVYYRKKFPKKIVQEESLYHVSITEEGVFSEHPAEGKKSIAWNELVKVSIRTTSDGPFRPDCFWVLSSKENELVIPSGATGEEKLRDFIFALPDFDHMRFIASMGMTSDMEFPCWIRKEEHIVSPSEIEKKIAQEREEKNPELEKFVEESRQKISQMGPEIDLAVRKEFFRCVLFAASAVGAGLNMHNSPWICIPLVILLGLGFIAYIGHVTKDLSMENEDEEFTE